MIYGRPSSSRLSTTSRGSKRNRDNCDLACTGEKGSEAGSLTRFARYSETGASVSMRSRWNPETVAPEPLGTIFDQPRAQLATPFRSSVEEAAARGNASSVQSPGDGWKRQRLLSPMRNLCVLSRKPTVTRVPKRTNFFGHGFRANRIIYFRSAIIPA